MTGPRTVADAIRPTINALAVNRVTFSGVTMEDLYNDIEELSEALMMLAQIIDQRAAAARMEHEEGGKSPW